MADPTPRLEPGGPLEVIEARTLFADAPPGRRSAASMVRIESTGRLLMCFSHVIGVELRNQAALVVTHSDDDGATWAEPLALYAYPGWFCLAMGGFARIADDDVKLMLGRILIDLSIGGTEPMTGWYVASTTTRDGGESVVGPLARDPIVPRVDRALRREQSASARPTAGSSGRSWGHAAATSAGTPGSVSATRTASTSSMPTIIAEADGRDYSDIDVIRLDDGRFLAVVREHQTRQSVTPIRADEGRTWSPIRPTPFLGSNIKLFRASLRGRRVCVPGRGPEPAWCEPERQPRTAARRGRSAASCTRPTRTRSTSRAACAGTRTWR